MAWSISYTSATSHVTFNVCADVGGGYFYILMPDTVTVLPSTLGGIRLSSNTCTSSPFVVQAAEFTQTGTYTMILADNTPQEVTQAQVWFYVSSPFSVTPPSGSSTTSTYSCINNICTPSTCTPGTGNCYTDSTCGGTYCTSPPPPTTCSTGDMNIFGTCIPGAYMILGGLAAVALLMKK